MKKWLLLGLMVNQLSYASECTVAYYGFKTRDQKVESILKHRGHKINRTNPKYWFESEVYFITLMGIKKRIIVVNLFERGKPHRIAYAQEAFGRFSEHFERVEKDFLREMPKCE